jgi:hypothetical protein
MLYNNAPAGNVNDGLGLGSQGGFGIYDGRTSTSENAKRLCSEHVRVTQKIGGGKRASILLSVAVSVPRIPSDKPTSGDFSNQSSGRFYQQTPDESQN